LKSSNNSRPKEYFLWIKSKSPIPFKDKEGIPLAQYSPSFVGLLPKVENAFLYKISPTSLA
jgi:hypothetical protein